MKCMLCEEDFEKDELMTSQAKFSLDDGREKIKIGRASCRERV